MAKTHVDGLLSIVPLFSRCTKKELAALSRLTTRMTLPAGDVVTRQGRVGREFIVIVDGKATVAIDGQTVATLGAGDFLGEIALLDGGPSHRHRDRRYRSGGQGHEPSGVRQPAGRGPLRHPPHPQRRGRPPAGRDATLVH